MDDRRTKISAISILVVMIVTACVITPKERTDDLLRK